MFIKGISAKPILRKISDSWYTNFATNHGISIPPAHGLSTLLPMVYQTISYGIMNSSFGRNEGGFNLPWGGSKYNDKKLTPGSKYHKENWTRGQNIIGKSTPGSIYHGVQNTIWHRYCFLICSKIFLGCELWTFWKSGEVIPFIPLPDLV